MPTAQTTPIALRSLVDRLSQARHRSDALFDLVRPEFLYERPIRERHRIIFYIGHLEAFDWNLLHKSVLGLKSFHPELDRLFAFGIDPVGGGLPSDLPRDWPSLAVVRDYVRGVRAAQDEKLAADILDSDLQPGAGFSLETLLNVAIEHRLMHLETLAYMLHQLPLNQKIRQPGAATPASQPVDHRMIKVEAGSVTMGLSRDKDTFGWDNEYEAHAVQVPEFEIDRYKVTNQQYLEFMKAGGYETRDFWDNDDWSWKNAQGISHPVFWTKHGEQWQYRAMFEELPLPLDWPVYVSHAEAAAYARWAGKELPTEEEWQRAAHGSGRSADGGNGQLNSVFGNFDFNRWDPIPVNAFAARNDASRIQGMLGNGWEWTSTTFAPFPGFEPFPFYRGYSADFFDGKHFVMKGGSARTAACLLRSTFRNWFQAHYQYVYAGFRCVSH